MKTLTVNQVERHAKRILHFVEMFKRGMGGEPDMLGQAELQDTLKFIQLLGIRKCLIGKNQLEKRGLAIRKGQSRKPVFVAYKALGHQEKYYWITQCVDLKATND